MSSWFPSTTAHYAGACSCPRWQALSTRRLALRKGMLRRPKRHQLHDVKIFWRFLACGRDPSMFACLEKTTLTAKPSDACNMFIYGTVTFLASPQALSTVSCLCSAYIGLSVSAEHMLLYHISHSCASNCHLELTPDLH